MAEVRNYKVVGRFPNEGMTFKNGIRIEFKAFHYSTSNPIEIATIEGSDAFKEGKKIKRVDKREASGTGPKTSDQVATTTPFSQDPGERNAFEQAKAKLEAEKAELAKMRAELEAEKKALTEGPTDPPGDDPDFGKTGEGPEGDPDKGTKDAGGDDKKDPETKAGDSKKKDSKSK